MMYIRRNSPIAGRRAFRAGQGEPTTSRRIGWSFVGDRAAILNEAPSGKENLPAAIQPLLDRLLSKDASARPSPGETRSELQRFVERPELLQAFAAPRRPFVGRESELSELRAHVE